MRHDRLSLRRIGSLGLIVHFMTAGLAGAAEFTNDTDWAGVNWTLADGDIIAGVHTNVGQFLIPAGATVRLMPYDTNVLLFGRVSIFALSVGLDGVLLGNAAGYPYGQGNGAGLPSGNSGSSGSGYGGRGSMGYLGLPGEAYGDPFAPMDMGSGGAQAGTYGDYKQAGGGAIRIHCAGTLTVNGTLSAGGSNGTSRSSGGSGGSIWLTASRVVGAGSILADGGAAVDTTRGSGGGGGRIAIDSPTNDFTGIIRAEGKHGTGPAYHGAFNFLSWTNRDVVIASPIALPPGTNWVFRSLTIQPGIRLDVQSVLGTAGATYADEVPTRIRVLGDLTILSGAVLSADGLGYRYNGGPGGGTSANNGCGGGAYGGRGGMGNSGFPGEIYGEPAAPNRLGSGGGGTGGTPGYGGNGAGALILDVGGTLTVEGTLSASGDRPNSRSGGGSGGSVWLKALTLAGAGSILADGGVANDLTTGGGGGGGRIAFDVTTNWFTGTLRAKGRPGSRSSGRSGTFNFSPSESLDLVISNDIALAPGNWVFRSLTVTNGAVLNIQSVLGSDSLSYADEGTSRVRVVKSVVIASGSVLSADGLGYRYAKGPGGTAAVNNGGPGGSYGGQGGAGGGGTIKPIYGDPWAPIRLGSGGAGLVATPGCGGCGGGTVILEAGSDITIQGTLSVNGENAVVGRAGGGSGGTVWLTAPVIKGTGTIAAGGGKGNYDSATSGGGGGGGGRILLFFGNTNLLRKATLSYTERPAELAFSGVFDATGGTGFAMGQEGTIRYQIGTYPFKGSLIVVR